MMKSFATAHRLASHGLMQPRTYKSFLAAGSVSRRSFASELTIPKHKMDLDIVHIDSRQKDA